jgi:peptidoglycan hydrolase CwlO-like protein
VLTLNGVTYSWRVKEFPDKHFDSDRHVGVLAQELEAVLPEAVETGEDGYKSVNYSQITPLLIEAVKEQQQQIETLKNDKAELQSQIDELKKMVEELMKK